MPELDRALVDAVKRRAGRPLAAIFGSSAPSEGSQLYELARAVGRMVAERGYGVVNGGYGGTMAASAQGAHEAGGIAIGVTLAGGRWRPNHWLTEEVPVAGPIERLLVLVALGDAYVILPGGTGTLLELAYLWEAIHKRWLPARPLILYGSEWGIVVEQVVARQPEAARWVTCVATLDELAEALPCPADA